MSKLSVIDRIQAHGLFLQIRWIDTLLSIDVFKVAVKMKVVLGLIGVVRLFPDTPIASLSIALLFRIKKTFSSANKYDLALRTIGVKLRKINEKKQS